MEDVTNLSNAENNIIPEKDRQTGVPLQHVWSGFKALENGIQMTTNQPTKPPNKILYPFPSPCQLSIYFKVSSVENRLYIKMH